MERKVVKNTDVRPGRVTKGDVANFEGTRRGLGPVTLLCEWVYLRVPVYHCKQLRSCTGGSSERDGVRSEGCNGACCDDHGEKNSA